MRVNIEVSGKFLGKSKIVNQPNWIVNIENKKPPGRLYIRWADHMGIYFMSGPLFRFWINLPLLNTYGLYISGDCSIMKIGCQHDNGHVCPCG
jgi:hypothetical protein